MMRAEVPKQSGVRAKVPVAVVIDDCHDNRELFAMVLFAAGFVVHGASDGAEGLAVAARERPDVLIVDLDMPVMDGFEVIERLRATPQGSRMRVIVVTASGDGTSRLRAREAGCDVFLTKPCPPSTLVEAARPRAERTG